MDTEEPVQAVRFESRFEEHREALLRFLQRRCPGDAEELAQDVWLRVFKVAPDCPDEDRFRAYLFVVARRVLIDAHRRRSARIELVAIDGREVAHADPEGDPEGQLRAGEVLSVVEETLLNMRPEIAEVFRWRMTGEASFQEIALRQRVGRNTALGRMFTATRRIAEALDRRGLLPTEPSEEK